MPLKQAPSTPLTPAPEPPPHDPDIVLPNALTVAMDGDGAPVQGAVRSISYHYEPVALMAITQPPVSNENLSTPLRRLVVRHKPSVTSDVPASNPALKTTSTRELPDAIVKLNLSRQSTGSAAFQEYHIKRHEPKPPQKPSFLSLEIPTVSQLRDGLHYIFRPLPQIKPSQANHSRDERKKEFVRWTHGLDHLLDSWTSESASSSSGPKEAKQARQNEMVDLLVDLNVSIEKSNDNMKRLFYQGTEQAGVDGVLGKLQTGSKLVRVMKAIEEFEEARDEWKDGQNCG